MHLQVTVRAASEEQVERNRALAKAGRRRAARWSKEAQAREARDLDEAVVGELERLALDEPPPPPDPYAARVHVRQRREDGHKFLAIGFAKRSPNEDELTVEFLKRLDD